MEDLVTEHFWQRRVELLDGRKSKPLCTSRLALALAASRVAKENLRLTRNAAVRRLAAAMEGWQ